jgi:D-inositol-3-phosphate glycosyltransferase
MVWNYGTEAARITVIPCGVDLRRFQPQPQSLARERLDLSPEQQLLLCVGRMEPLKGIDSLIQALALLCQRRPDWRDTLCVLVVGGEPESAPERWNAEQRRLDALRRELGVAAAVRFLGAQSQERLPDYYAAVDAVAVPSHYESFGMVALEAMACGAPVVASNVGGLSSTIEDGRSGLLVPHDNPTALADRLELILANDMRRAELRCGARQRALSYSWSSVARHMRRLYADVIEQGTAAQPAARRLANVS